MSVVIKPVINDNNVPNSSDTNMTGIERNISL